MRVVHAAHFVVVNILRAHLADQPVDGLIGFLRDGFLRLHLQDQVRAALQVEAELDLVAKLSLICASEVGNVGSADQPVNAADNDQQR